MKLASITDVKSFLDKSDSDHDTLLEIMVGAVSAAMEGYTNRYFEKQSRTQYFTAGGNVFQLKAFPIDAVIATVVTVDGTIQTEGSDYAVFHDKGYLEFMTSTTVVEPKNISVTYTGGYAWTTGSGSLAVPDDLKYGCIIQSVYNFRNRRNLGVNSISLPDGSINVNNQDEFLPQVISILDRYRI